MPSLDATFSRPAERQRPRNPRERAPARPTRGTRTPPATPCGPARLLGVATARQRRSRQRTHLRRPRRRAADRCSGSQADLRGVPQPRPHERPRPNSGPTWGPRPASPGLNPRLGRCSGMTPERHSEAPPALLAWTRATFSRWLVAAARTAARTAARVGQQDDRDDDYR
jgi:hypothetical protein